MDLWNKPDWMTNTDYRILSALAECEPLPVQSPSVIAKNLGISQEHTNRRLLEFADRGYVEKVDRGYYRITDKGRSFISD